MERMGTAKTGTPQPSTPIFTSSASLTALMVSSTSRWTGVPTFQ